MDRIEKMERDLRNTRRACAMLAVFVLAGGFAAGWASKHTNVSDELVAKKLRIVDADGNDAIALYVEDGASMLTVGAEGMGSISLVAKDNVCGLSAITGQEKMPVAAIAVAPTGAEIGVADTENNHAIGLIQPAREKGTIKHH